MIKVIEHGKKRIAECYSCGCKYSYEKEDIQTDQTHPQEWIDFVQCPECGTNNNV